MGTASLLRRYTDHLAMPSFTIDSHDDLPQGCTSLVDAGLGRHNDESAPLHEVQPISCFVRDAEGRVLGGAIGRRWGECCELMQLWVEPSSRGQGLGARLVLAFEDHARRRGCKVAYLETFGFQAPGLYRRLGYAVEFVRDAYPHGIEKVFMAKRLDERAAEGT